MSAETSRSSRSGGAVQLREFIGRQAIKISLAAPTRTKCKARLMRFREMGIISPSLAQWAMAVHGLRHE